MRRPLPKALADAPELLPGLDLYYYAFVDLSTCRSMGFGPGPIPWTAISEYARARGLEREQTDDLFYHIPLLDAAYLEHVHAKMKSEQNARVGSKGPKPRPKGKR